MISPKNLYDCKVGDIVFHYEWWSDGRCKKTPQIVVEVVDESKKHNLRTLYLLSLNEWRLNPQSPKRKRIFLFDNSQTPIITNSLLGILFCTTDDLHFSPLKDKLLKVRNFMMRELERKKL